ncbi:hypothetical protein L0P51_05775 [Acetatifactor sp. DFI.5.50]|nr:hypothetical protein [Lacrimispora saccharolytica]MCG4780443.1 hypothetical protein [Acetatifactor sp. DFI.5.50]
MGKMIDEGELVKVLEERATNEAICGYMTAYDVTNSIIDEVNEQPTAYDPDRVLHQLEERTAFLKYCTKYGNKTKEQQSKSYDTMMMYEVKDLVDDLLEIVKAGGADDTH